jgi:hypothetical protein
MKMSERDVAALFETEVSQQAGPKVLIALAPIKTWMSPESLETASESGQTLKFIGVKDVAGSITKGNTYVTTHWYIGAWEHGTPTRLYADLEDDAGLVAKVTLGDPAEMVNHPVQLDLDHLKAQMVEDSVTKIQFKTKTLDALLEQMQVGKASGFSIGALVRCRKGMRNTSFGPDNVGRIVKFRNSADAEETFYNVVAQEASIRSGAHYRFDCVVATLDTDDDLKLIYADTQRLELVQ